MKRLRVLHVIGGGEFGGAERHILNLAGAIDPQRVELTVCCLFEAPFFQVAREAGLPAVAVPMRRKADIASLKRLRTYIVENKFDIVHTHGVRANLVGRIAARGVPGVRAVVTTVHSQITLDYPGLVNRLTNIFTEKALRRLTTHFIAVSEGLKESLINEGVPPEKITVIYNGLDLAKFQPASPGGSFLAGWGIKGSRPVVAIVGRLHSVKGHTYFLQAAALFAQNSPEARFLVVGYGPERPELENLTRDLGLADKVIFTGFVEDIPSLLGEIDLLVISSLSEGLPFTAVEAMAAGVPVLATAVGGLKELLEHEKTGLLVPARDPQALATGMAWIAQHPDRVQQMVQKGRKVIENKFSAAAMARQTEQLYRRVLGIAGDN